MIYFDYPKVKHSLARTALQDPYPAWFIDAQGIIRGANLMALWLSGTLKLTEPIRPDVLLGKNMFDIFANTFKRIPIEQNIEYYSKKSSMMKRMKANSHAELPVYSNFVTAMKRDPLLEKIYEEASLYPDKEWEHPFFIVPPDPGDSPRLLEFRITMFRLAGDTGFLSMCTPTGTTLSEIEKQYGLLINEYGEEVYVQLDDLDSDYKVSNQDLIKLGMHFPPYYPALIQDPLWYISMENRAHELLAGRPTVGTHFFELFFAPQLRKWMGPIQETTAPRAIKYFTYFTSTYVDEEHELHVEYTNTMKSLLQLQDFRYMQGVSQRLNIHLIIPDDTEAPFYTCRVILPCAFSRHMTLQFRSMVRILYRNPLVRTDIHDYEETLVPENYETEVALILMHLRAPSQEYLDENPDLDAYMQFVWLLTVLRTVKERLTKPEDAAHSSWEPVSAFNRISSMLTIERGKHAADDMTWISTEFKEIIETLENRNIVDKDKVLALLYGFTAILGTLSQVSEFLLAEIERCKSIELI